MRWKGFILFGAFVFIFACQPRISINLENPTNLAERLLYRLHDRNHALKTFKGIGAIRFWNSAGSQSARIAWLGETNGRLRIEILGPTGRPLMKIAHDGTMLYFYSIRAAGMEKSRIRNPGLGRVIDVPVTVRDLTHLLAGKIPVYKHDQVEITQKDDPLATQLLLKRFWRGLIEEIEFTAGRRHVETIRVYDWQKLRYQVRLSAYRQIDGFDIAGHIVIDNGKSAGFEIYVDRYWPNVDVAGDQFVLTPL